MTQHDTTMLRCVFTVRSCSKAWQAQLVLLDPSLASMSLLECKRHCSHLFATCEVRQSDYHPIIIRFFSILQDSSRLFKTLQDSSTSCAPVSVPGTMPETLLQPQLMHIFSTFAMEAGQHVCGKHANSGQIWDQHYPEHESSVHFANSIAKGNMTAT